MPSWLSVEEALERILETVFVLEGIERPLLESLGSVLAEDVRSPVNVPPLPNTSMDGYAVRQGGVQEAGAFSPVSLRVVGHLPAGQVFHETVGVGEALRIMTGAPIPHGADAVVPFEDTDELERIARGEGVGEAIRVLKAVALGENIRPAGEDVREGQVVLKTGAVLRPAEIGVLASVGRSMVRVFRRPTIAILATGNELVDPPDALSEGKIYDSNSYALASSVLRYGGIPRLLGIARDDRASLEAKVHEGTEADMLITSAGVSRGDYDIVKDVLMKLGNVAFWTVRMRPAKPLAFGVLRRNASINCPGLPHLGLPGNPVSALVAFEQFARPAILKMQGRTAWAKPAVRAVLQDRLVNGDGRRVYARVHVEKKDGTYSARLTGPQGSGILTSLTKANGLAICPDDVDFIREGETVEVQMLDWQEEQA